MEYFFSRFSHEKAGDFIMIQTGDTTCDYYSNVPFFGMKGYQVANKLTMLSMMWHS